MAKLEQVKRHAGILGDGLLSKYPSKYLHKIATFKTGARQERCSAVELAQLKPHVLDPLVYDSRRMHHVLIPPTNCRTTARAFARFYAAVAAGKLVKPETLEQVSASSVPPVATVVVT